MALPINSSIISARVSASSKPYQAQGSAPPAAQPQLSLIRTSSAHTYDSDPVNVSKLRERVAERASNTLLSASLSVTRKQNAAENLMATADTLLKKAQEIKNEPSFLRQAELQTEAEDLVGETSANYAAAAQNEPSIAEDETVSTVMKTGADINDPQKTHTTAISAVPSPAALGITSLSFEKSAIDGTIASLSNIRASLAVSRAAYASAETDIAGAVAQHTADALADASAQTTQTLDLADKIKLSMTLDSIPDIKGLVDLEQLTAPPLARITPPAHGAAQEKTRENAVPPSQLAALSAIA